MPLFQAEARLSLKGPTAVSASRLTRACKPLPTKPTTLRCQTLQAP